MFNYFLSIVIKIMTKIIKTAKKAVKDKKLPASKTIKKDTDDIKATIIAQLQKIAGIY